MNKLPLRITIILEDDLAKILRHEQSQLIKKSTKSISLSDVLNQTLRNSLKK